MSTGGPGRRSASPQTRPSVCLVWTSPAILDLLLQTATQHVGGAETQLAALGRQLAARGWPVSFVVCDEGQDADVTTADGIRVLSAYRRESGPRALRFWCHKLPGLWRALRRADADLNIVRGRSWLVGATALLSRRLGRKTVYWAASAADARRPRVTAWQWLNPVAALERLGVARADLVIVQTRDQQERIQQELGRSSAIVRNLWLDEPHAPLSTSRRTVLWVGEMRPIKQPDVCLDIARRLPHLDFCLVGGRDESDPSLLDRMGEAARDLPNVALVGHVPFSKVGGYFDQAAVLLCTSESEGFPNTFLQAWRRGIPVVATVDPDQVIRRGRLGYHGTDPADLAAHIDLLVASPDERAAIAERAQAYMRQHHDPAVVMPALEGLLMDLVSAGNRR